MTNVGSAKSPALTDLVGPLMRLVCRGNENAACAVNY